MQGSKTMEQLIDKLCDHLPIDRIKLLIENGFDEWETITFMKGEQLAELGFTPQECIIIMVAINSQSKEIGEKEIFSEEAMQVVLKKAKQAEKIRHQLIMKQQVEQKMQKMQMQQQQQEKHQQIKEYPPKPITENILMKGLAIKGKVPLNKITLMSLEEKEITHICEMEKVPQLQNLHLSHNHIYKIQNLDHLTKLRVLKLQKNEIIKMEGLSKLISLEQLYLPENHISRFEGLTQNKKLHMINISRQKSKHSLTFQEQTCEALAYSLQTFICDDNRVRDISNFKHFKVLNTLNLKGNLLADMEVLSEPFGGMERLKVMDFRSNPLSTLPKYRDYIVILCKKQLDNKKILPKERQYLVKLYSLKHAKQMRQQNKQMKNILPKQNDLHVTKLQEGSGTYSHGTDLRGNVAYANTKIHKH